LGIAVDHYRLVTLFLQRERGVAAAVIEFYSLPYAIRTRTEDHDLLSVCCVGFILVFVGRVQIRRERLELGPASVDTFEHRIDAASVAVLAHFLLGGRQNGRQALIGKTCTLRVSKRSIRDRLKPHASKFPLVLRDLKQVV